MVAVVKFGCNCERSLVWFGMVGRGYVMNVGRGYVMNVGRGYVGHYSQSVRKVNYQGRHRAARAAKNDSFIVRY